MNQSKLKAKPTVTKGGGGTRRRTSQDLFTSTLIIGRLTGAILFPSSKPGKGEKANL